MLTVSGAVARPMVIEVPDRCAAAVRPPAGRRPAAAPGRADRRLPRQVDRRGRPSTRRSSPATPWPRSAARWARARSCRSARRPARSASRCGWRNWLAAETAGQCGPCNLGLPGRGARPGGRPQRRRPGRAGGAAQVTQAVKGRGACTHPDGSAMFLESTCQGVHRRPRRACPGRRLRPARRRSAAVRCRCPPPATRTAEESIPSGEKIFVDWTLCQGHGLCADILPELIRLGADGYPAVAQPRSRCICGGEAPSAPCAAAPRWRCASRTRPPSPPNRPSSRGAAAGARRQTQGPGQRPRR